MMTQETNHPSISGYLSFPGYLNIPDYPSVPNYPSVPTIQEVVEIADYVLRRLEQQGVSSDERSYLEGEANFLIRFLRREFPIRRPPLLPCERAQPTIVAERAVQDANAVIADATIERLRGVFPLTIT